MSGHKGKGIAFDLPPAGAPVQAPAQPVTGAMRSFGIAQEVHALRSQVQQLEGERGAQRMDPASIKPSRWANRHEASFAGTEFEQLKAEIANAGGNVQPIKVRPLADVPADGARYEVVFGHRRHRACLDLGLPVLAVVQELPDRDLFVEMERENRNRAGLSAFEQGTMYRRALDEGLFPSLRMLAQSIGRDPGDVSKALSIAQLPADVIDAFRAPTEIQFRHAADLKAALARDPAAVLARARSLAGSDTPAAEVLQQLLAAPAEKRGVGPSNTPAAAAPAERKLRLGKGRAAVLRSDGQRARLELDADLQALPEARWAELERMLREFLAGGT